MHGANPGCRPKVSPVRAPSRLPLTWPDLNLSSRDASSLVMNNPALPPSPRAIRLAGWVFVSLGLALAVGMGVVTSYLARVVAAPEAPSAGTHWTGDHAMTVQMFGMFGAVILFGIVAVLNGLWIVRRGAFSPVLRVALLVIGAAMLADAVLFILTHGDA